MQFKTFANTMQKLHWAVAEKHTCEGRCTSGRIGMCFTKTMASALRNHCKPVAGIPVGRGKVFPKPWPTSCKDQVNQMRKRTVADPAFQAKIINVLRMNSATLIYMCKFCLQKLSGKDNSKLFCNWLYNQKFMVLLLSFDLTLLDAPPLFAQS
jgi:hypothetical protein